MVGKGEKRGENNRKNNRFCVRFSDEDMRMLNELIADIGVARSEIVRRAVKMLYFSRKYR